MTRYRIIALAAGVIAAGGATTGLVIWDLSHTQVQSRTLLASRNHGSTALLATNTQPALTAPAAATTWLHCPMTDLGGGLQCTQHDGTYVALSQNGSPVYQTHTPMPVANGQGRKGWLFDGSSAYAQASSTAVTNPGAVTGITIEAVGALTANSNHTIASTTDGSAATRGITFWYSGGGLYCRVNGDNSTMHNTSGVWTTDNKVHHFACTKSWSGAAWSGVIYVDGVAISGDSGASASNDLSNSYAFTVGRQGNGTAYWQGSLYEVLVTKTAKSAATILANYRGILATGAYITDDANILAHYKFNDLSGILSDSTTNANHLTEIFGDPTAGYDNLPWPMSGGTFSRRAVWTPSGDSAYFAAGENATGDQTTNNFSASFWFLSTDNEVGAGANGYIIAKYIASTVGWGVFINGGSMYILVYSDQGQAFGAVVSTVPRGWHFYTINWNRAGNAYAYMDGASVGLNVDISAISHTLSAASPLTLFRYNGSATYDVKNAALADLLVADGLTTLAEHQAMYKAFKVPDGITYSQTTAMKWRLPDNENGVRYGTFGPGQWPFTYDDQPEPVGDNPLRLAFPRSPARTNVLGYTNEFDSWSGTGVTVTANDVEAPDGSMTADTATYGTDGNYWRKAAVGGGTIAAGETWCASLLIKKISGTCGSFVIYDFGQNHWSSGFTPTTLWQRYSWCNTNAGDVKGIMLGAAADNTSCAVALADAQYEQNNVTDPCTVTTGNVSQTCNASYYKIDFSASAAYMPTALTNAELMMRATDAPWTSTPAPKVIAQVGNWAQLSHGVTTDGVLRGAAGGDLVYVGRGKPVQHTAVNRTYRLGFDAGSNYFTVDDKKAPTAFSRVAAPMVDKYSLNSYMLSVGCDQNGTNCSYGPVERVEVASHPWPPTASQTVAADHVITIDGTGAGYLQNAATPDLCNYDFGVADANRWCWQMGDLSGSIYDKVNGVALAPTGTPLYQVPSGLIGRGQGRRGANFNAARVEAGSTSVLSLSGYSAATIEVTAASATPTAASSQGFIGSASDSGESGWSLYVDSGNFYCRIVQPGPNTRYRSVAAAISNSNPHTYACIIVKTAGLWDVSAVYIDGVLRTSTPGVGTQPTDLTNSVAVAIGSVQGASNPLNGQVYEARVSNVERSAGDLLASYKQSVQTGRYWTDDANTVAHYKFDEATLANGVGLRDHSGNGNHLTVVTGSPTPLYRAAPWPMGSGEVKPAVGTSGGSNYFSITENTVAPADSQPFSAAAWSRVEPNASGNHYPIFIGHVPTADKYWYLYVDSDFTGNAVMWLHTANGDCYARRTGVDYRDSRWHLFAGKVTFAGGTYTPLISVDGEAFGYNVSTCTGSPVPTTGNLQIAANSQTGKYHQVAGAAVWKNYALTDANVATLYGTSDPTGQYLTYARTSTSTKGICYDVANDPVDGMRVRCFKDGEVPYAYRSEYTAAAGNEYDGLGLPRDAAVTNLAHYSERLDQWATKVGCTVSADAALAPDGTKTADAIVEDATLSGHYVDSGDNFGSAAAVATTSCVYLKAATRSYAWVQTITSGAAPYAYFRLDDCTVGNAYAGASNLRTKGVGNGWCKCCFDWTATANPVRSLIGGSTTGGDPGLNYSGTNGATALYTWGNYVNQNDENVYCPTPSNATTTCSAPSSMYVAASNISGWTRAKGVISYIGFQSQNSVGFHLEPGAFNNHGTVGHNPYSGLWQVFDQSGTEEQRPVAAAGPGAALGGSLLVFDSTGAFYASTRRSYMHQFTSVYAGPVSTWTVDTDTNWTATGGSDLHIGAQMDGTFPINGSVQLISVYGTRW